MIERLTPPPLHAPTPADIASGAAERAGGTRGGPHRWFRSPDPLSPLPDGYKWTALFISTLGMLMATIDGSIVLISLPDIFRGIGLDPLLPGNSFYLLWMILGFLVTTSVLVVTLGRLGDMYGRVRVYNLGFAVFTVFSLALSVTWMTGQAAGMYLIVMRIFQGVGAAMLMANSAAILTDAFPEDQRGLALGVNQAAAFSGAFIGLILGGILAPINWRLIFLVSVPIGLFATVWGHLRLRELGQRRSSRIDWPGNATFALGLVLIMVGITYGIEPYGGHAMGWTNPGHRARWSGAPCCSSPSASWSCACPSRCSGYSSSRSAPSRGRHRQLPRRHQPRRPDVHAHHLAPGDLAAPARLLLLRHPAVGGHRHDPADRRHADRRARSRGSSPTATAPGPSPPAA